MNNVTCVTCVHAEFDPAWGQYRCKRLAHMIEDPQRLYTCKHYDNNPDAKPILCKKWTVK